MAVSRNAGRILKRERKKLMKEEKVMAQKIVKMVLD